MENIYCIEIAFSHNRIGDATLPESRIALAEQQALTLFANCFGGGQRYHSMGSYRAALNEVAVGQCSVIRAYALEVKEHWDRLHTLAREIASLLEQECVLLSSVALDGSLLFVEPE